MTVTVICADDGTDDDYLVRTAKCAVQLYAYQ
jgi:hypothetical protein